MRHALRIALLAALTIHEITLGAQQPALNVSVAPEKTRFARGERVFCWLQVSPAESGGVLERSTLEGSRVILTRPDGTERVDLGGVLIDGPTTFSQYRGGWTLREPAQIGTYAVVYEVSGARSVPVSFSVEDVDLLDRIQATFTLPSPLQLDAPETTATFLVRNQTDEPIRFNGADLQTIFPSGVSVRLTAGSNPGWHHSFLTTWNLLAEIPSPLAVGRDSDVCWRSQRPAKGLLPIARASERNCNSHQEVRQWR